MEQMAKDLLAAQRAGDVSAQSSVLKRIADATRPLRRVNAASASPMPGRFFEKVVFGLNDCWVWRGHVDEIGYGRFPYEGENKAHRVAYALFNGAIPNGMLVLHKCDNRQCVNPAHLFLGTQKDNMADMSAKDRGVAPRLFGERNPMSKLSAEQVAEIRAMVEGGAKQIDACKRFGVSPMTVSRIIRRQAWK